MDIQAKLDKCRAEFTRQQKMDKDYAPPPWAPWVYRHGSTNMKFFVELRNLNPSRLKEAEKAIHKAERHDGYGLIAEESAATACALLGVEIGD